MNTELSLGQMHIVKNVGVALLCGPNHVIDDCICPDKIFQNHGFAPDAKIFYKQNSIGVITSSKIKKNLLYYCVKLNLLLDEGLYNCEFNINKMFSVYENDKYFLEQIIVDSIVIETKCDKF